MQRTITKGVILAGGRGTRLLPLTKTTNKHLLTVGGRPMVYYPLQTIIKSGVEDVLVVTNTEHVGAFVDVLGYGEKFGINISYKAQDEPKGIAHALSFAKDFACGENICVMLGDNFFEDDIDVGNFKGGARIYLKEVENPNEFGVAEIDEAGRVSSITEKPQNPKSNFAVTGVYLYDSTVFDTIKTLQPSARGELEITDVNTAYLRQNKLDFRILTGHWRDMATMKA